MKDVFKMIKGQVIDSVQGLEKQSEMLVINFKSGDSIKMYHDQDCCEDVWLEDFESPKNLIGATIVDLVIDENQEDSEWGSRTWTFYKLMTTKGELFLRWCGESNGYYSEDVDIIYTELDGSKHCYNKYY